MEDMDTALDLLHRIAALHPWHSEGGVNICAFCDGAWDHREDCLWLRIQAFMVPQRV
jgi:hypothetical protein